jgi:CheY-like chemotaxis protein
MTIFVVTDSKAVRKAFAPAVRSRTYTVEFLPTGNLADAVRRADSVPDSFLYVDADGLDGRSFKRRLGQLREARPYRFGIVDGNHSVLDIAEVFHNSAADYVGKALLAEGLSTARLRRVVEYDPSPAVRRSAGHVPEHEQQTIIPSGVDWSGVRDGEEYTFIMLYAGIDGAGELRRKSSESFLASLRKAFGAVLERSFSDYEARVWMWKEEEGLLLMPFDGQDFEVIVPALRLVLNRVVINVEELLQFGEISWRLALHLGNTTYRSSGRTGGIVSESVNFMFHLGSRFVDAGGLAVTESCLDLIPEPVRPLLNHRGTFESVHVYSLRDLL